MFSQGTTRPHFLTPGTQHLKLTCQIVLDTLQPLKLRILLRPGALQKHQEPEAEHTRMRTHTRTHAHTHTHAHAHTHARTCTPTGQGSRGRAVHLSIRGLTRCGSVPGWVLPRGPWLQVCRGPLTPAVESCTSPQTPHYTGHHTCCLTRPSCECLHRTPANTMN